MVENKIIPKIRFAGFNDAWEQRKVGDIAEVVSGGTPDTNNPDYWEGDINWYAPAEISDQIYVSESERKITELGLQKSSAKMLPAEKTILFTSRAGIGKVAILRHSACTNQGFQSLILKDGYVPYFVYSMGKQLKEKAEAVASGSTFLEISGKMLANLDVMMPNREEQMKMASYFQGLDNLITLHQRKLEKLRKIKKSMLEKMFPKNGSNVPEIRFAGFTDAWEQRKLEFYLDVSNEKNKDNVYSKQDVLSVSGEYGIVNQIEFQGRSFAGVSVSNYGLVRTGDIVYTKSPLNSNPYGIIKTNKGITGIVSTLYAVYQPNKNTFPEFVQVYFEQYARMNNYMHPLVNKGAKNDMKVSAKNALKGNVIFPSYEEQKVISEYFKNLDNLITLHQRKLEKLRKIKKSMLEKMFI